ncbi:competence type IV pilus major pilin ComGC [Evansella halocellulosilytica]|uniref:competence type IV pilus major pilin ComGC n=1 Tax=Evansella halocellulosilytica TaxID=2011013 RepID=UPI00211B8B78|nr:competence type IV pilus major pilin ComGC [Evansella halocellulosilytica]
MNKSIMKYAKRMTLLPRVLINKSMNQRGFTLIEMIIVLLIISILLLIIVPNMTRNQSVANDMGCEATIELLQTQVAVYQLEHQHQLPSSIDDLAEYVSRSDMTCPDGKELTIDEDGTITLVQ